MRSEWRRRRRGRKEGGGGRKRREEGGREERKEEREGPEEDLGDGVEERMRTERQSAETKGEEGRRRRKADG